MIKKLINLSLIILILNFFIIVGQYYFSDKNYLLLKKNRSERASINYDNILDIPVLTNDTDKAIQFKTGYEDSNEKKFKKNFWDVFKK